MVIFNGYSGITKGYSRKSHGSFSIVAFNRIFLESRVPCRVAQTQVIWLYCYIPITIFIICGLNTYNQYNIMYRLYNLIECQLANSSNIILYYFRKSGRFTSASPFKIFKHTAKMSHQSLNFDNFHPAPGSFVRSTRLHCLRRD